MEYIIVILISAAILFGSYYIIAIILMWPRLLAKYIYRKEDFSQKKIKKLRTVFLIAQFTIFFISFLVSYFFHFEAPENSPILTLLIMGLSFGGIIALFELFIQFWFPRSLGMTLVPEPPNMLLREVGCLWFHQIVWIPTVFAILALFVFSHVAGIVALAMGIIIRIKLKHLVVKDEKKDKLEYYVERLGHKNQRVRVLSVIMIGDIGGPRALQSLIDLIHTRPYLLEHAMAIKTLGRMKDASAVLPLLYCISSTFEEEIKFIDMHQGVSKALAKITKNDFGQLVDLLKHEDASIRAATARVLGFIKDLRAVEALLSVALKDEDQTTRNYSFWALGFIAGERAKKHAGGDMNKWNEWWEQKKKSLSKR